jgi:CRISPR-associated endonuclease/helicase Cas3
MEPVIVAVEDEPRSILARLREGAIASSVAARRLQTFIVQVPPAWRRRLIDNGQAAYIAGYGEQFVELKNKSLYTPETGLLWEEADILSDYFL